MAKVPYLEAVLSPALISACSIFRSHADRISPLLLDKWPSFAEIQAEHTGEL